MPRARRERLNTLPRVRRPVLALAGLLLLAGPTVLAFFTGGFFEGPRAAAATIAWALVLVLAVAGPLPFPRTTAGRVAVAGLAGLAVWSAISLAWAPMVSPGFHNAQRILLYLGVLLAAVAALRDPRLVRAAEPALAAGALTVIAYGLAGRLLPEVFNLERSFVAGGRLEQPLTYWNAEGLLACIGVLLCARLAGDPSRPGWMRAATAAACAPLGMGLYLTYSRGAVAVTLLGLIVLLAAVPTWVQLRAVVTGVAAAVLAALLAASFSGVASLEGSAADQGGEGAIVLAGLLALAALAAFAATRAPREDRARLRFARHLPAVAGAAALACVAGLVVGGLVETAGNAENAGAKASRFTSVSSVRYEYWRVGGRAFLDRPLQGEGSGGFRVLWRQEREVDAVALEVHSLVMEMVTELGLPGLLLLALLVGGVAVSAGAALRAGSPLAPAATAVCVAWLMHASFDWDWQMPAVTLPALILAGGLIAGSETVSAMSRGSAPAPGPRAARRAP